MIAAESVSDDLVVLGRLGKAHGLKGEIRFFPYGCDRQTFESLSALHTDQGGINIQYVRSSGAFWIVQIRGVATRDAAAALTGQLVYAPQKDLPELPEMEFYEADLAEARVHSSKGEDFGIIAEILPHPENDILVVRDELGRERLIPTLRHVLKAWDAEARLLTVTWTDPEDDTQPGDDEDRS